MAMFPITSENSDFYKEVRGTKRDAFTHINLIREDRG